MHRDTRILFNAYVSQIALLNGISAAEVKETQFAVAPAVEQKLEAVIKHSHEFLGLITIQPVIQQTGDKVGLGTTRTMAGRTDTDANDRNPGDPTDTAKKDTYFCRLTEFDSSIKYAKIDAWRHKPEFQTLFRDAIARQQGLDRIMIGWNGTSAAAQTDRAANPLLQDVNLGWLYKIRTNAPAQVLQDGDLTVYANGANNPGLKKIYVKAGVDLYDESLDNKTTADADYSSIDALVLDAKSLIPEWHRSRTDLVVIVGHDLVDDKIFNIAQKTGATATEVEAMDRIIRSTRQLGGLEAVRVPFFPGNAILITTLENIAIYFQEGTRRRQIIDEPRRNRIANYESVNEDYIVEDYELCALVENIVTGEAPARPAAP